MSSGSIVANAQVNVLPLPLSALSQTSGTAATNNRNPLFSQSRLIMNDISDVKEVYSKVKI